jgi:hypothetical protein
MERIERIEQLKRRQSRLMDMLGSNNVILRKEIEEYYKEKYGFYEGAKIQWIEDGKIVKGKLTVLRFWFAGVYNDCTFEESRVGSHKEYLWVQRYARNGKLLGKTETLTDFDKIELKVLK